MGASGVGRAAAVTFTGSDQERLKQVIAVRDEIRDKLQNWNESSQRLYRTR